MTEPKWVIPSPNNETWAMFRDADGIWQEVRYIVTQTEDEGPEYLEGRTFQTGTASPVKQDEAWQRIDDEEDLTPELRNELEKFFHG